MKNDLGIFLYFYQYHAIALEGSALGELHYFWLDIYYSLYIYLVTFDLSLLWVDRLDMVHSPVYVQVIIIFSLSHPFPVVKYK
jgi:hypothetical protein